MNIGLHPAPGLGDLLPGFFVVPQDPLSGPASYVPGIGDILPGSYSVPQNPVVNYNVGRVLPIGTDPHATGRVNGIAGMGCGCGGSCGGCGGGGLSGVSEDFSKFTADLTSGNIMQAVQDTVFGVPVWAIGVGLAFFLMAGGSEHSYVGRGRRAARAAAGAF